jgi:hypothetical protein
MFACLLPAILFCSPQATPPGSSAASLQDLLSIPYIEDAVQDAQGRWVTFTHPDQVLPGPGLNCSGFTLMCAQRLLGYGGTLEEATQDRLGDSGKDAKRGQDWDFAWDLLLNLSEGHRRRVLLPEGEARIEDCSGSTLRGFSMEDTAAWEKVLARIQPDCVYLGSISRVTKRGPQHYHAVVLLKEKAGPVWLYQTLPKGRSHRLNLSSPQGFARMQGMFGEKKRILVLEVEPGPAGKR